MSNSKKDNVNFKIVKEKSKTIEHWKLALYWFEVLMFMQRLKTTPQLEYKKAPLYASFKSSWARTIGKWFRLILVIVPTIVLVRLVIDYSNTVLWWALTIASSPMIVISYYNLMADIVCKIRVKAYEASIDDDIYVEQRYGRPGGGKTSSAFYTAKILADIMWKKIKQEYKLLKPYLNDIPFWNTKAREDAQEIIDAYNFYKNSGTYPCLWSSVPGFVDGVPVNRLTANHLMQRDRLPFGTVAILDEVSLILPQELFRNKPVEIEELAKFPRHFGDLHIITTEQGRDNVFKGLRNSAGRIRCMLKQQWILKPRILIWIYDKLLSKTEHMTRTKATFFRVLNKVINAIGYRRYTYYDSGTEDLREVSKEKTFILPSFLNVTYDSRAFKNAYRCKDEPLKQSSWEHLRLSKEELDEIFTKELQERKTKAEVRSEENRKRREEERRKKEEEKARNNAA